MRKLRNLAVFALMLAASTTFATSTTIGSQTKFDGGEPPPLCLPSDPNCKP